MKKFIGLGVIAWLAGAAPDAFAQESTDFQPVRNRSPRIHDPSTPVKLGDTWWVFSTGRGIGLRKSKDLVTWTEEKPVFTDFPEWHREVTPNQDRNLWAPDILRHKGQYRLYYSVSALGKRTSGIGLATSPAIDPADPECRWTDRGIIHRTTPESDHNAIDPAMLIDADGRHWMCFGSFWKGIHLMELDPDTGLRHPQRGELRQLAWNDTIEAAAIRREGGYYYLFVNWGHCCRGVDSTYEIRVGRSRAVTGPYLDKEGRDLATGGGTLLLATEGDRIGPGHPSFVEAERGTVMFYHYYDKRRRGAASIGWKALEIDEAGWPVLKDEWPGAGQAR